MKKALSLLLAALLLTGCGKQTVAEVTVPETTLPAVAETAPAPAAEAAYTSQFMKETTIYLSDETINVEGNQESVVFSNDIRYYEDRDTYASGNPYGDGSDRDKHTAEEAAAHTVVNITKPGAYRVTGKLSAGQIRVDLGFDAYYDPEAVVELILDDADITCTVAPAILFENVYECDGEWSEDTAKADVDTTAAGANLILEGQNTVHGAYVAKIYKDTEGEKKLCKQDGAIYSYMSMNVYGPGALELTAENEGMDTELHLTIHSGDITILSDNDGINTNEDGVSVTTINGGILTIYAGLGEEGDGIDSNGYLVINGGCVYSSAKPISDAGLDSDLGSYIHGGIVIATGSAMDWAESDSEQVTMNLQFAQQQTAGAKITITDESGAEIFSFQDDSEFARGFRGLILSHPNFTVGSTYHVYADGVQMVYSGNSLGGFPGGFGGGRGPGGFDPSQMGEMPEGFQPGQMPEGFEMPEGFDPSQFEGRGDRPQGGRDNMMPPEGFDRERPEGMEMPEGFDPSQFEGRGPRPQGGEGMTPPEGFENFGGDPSANAEPSTEFYMADKVNAFSGVKAL